MFRPTPAVLLRWSMLYWVSLAIAALIYKAYPAAGASRLAHGHFWISVVALPVLLAMLFAFVRGNTAIEPVLGIASIAVLVATLLLVVNVFKHVHD